MRILLVEDEPSAARMLAKGPREQTYAVDLAGDGRRALEQAYLNEYDLIILDVMLPGASGFEVCRELRAGGSAVPVLMLTARDAVEDRVEGLDAGADDYLAKPFDFDELLARVRALLRRGPALRPEVIRVGDLTVDTRAKRVSRAGLAVELTAKEFALIDDLARRAGEVVGRADIAEHVWDESYEPFSKVIEVFIQRLRRKVDEGHPVKLIRTRRGAGYVLTAEGPNPLLESVRARLTLWYLSVLALALATFGAGVYSLRARACPHRARYPTTRPCSTPCGKTPTATTATASRSGASPSERRASPTSFWLTSRSKPSKTNLSCS